MCHTKKELLSQQPMYLQFIILGNDDHPSKNMNLKFTEYLMHLFTFYDIECTDEKLFCKNVFPYMTTFLWMFLS